MKKRVHSRRIARIARGYLRRHDDLRIRIDRKVTLVSVEAASGCLVAMTRFRIDDGDDAIGGDAPSNRETAAREGFEILSQYGGQELDRVANRLV